MSGIHEALLATKGKQHSTTSRKPPVLQLYLPWSNHPTHSKLLILRSLLTHYMVNLALETHVAWDFIKDGQSLKDHTDFLLYIVCQSDPRLRNLAKDEATKLVSENPALDNLLNEVWVAGRGYRKIRSLTTEDSWKCTFVGNAHEMFKEHILHYTTTLKDPYVPYCAIVWSTGTGKSRAVDDFSTYDFVILINLRDSTEGIGGFPAADVSVYRFLMLGSFARIV
ncbi:hypothetical protein BDP27DRAFT_1365202 [Rhodocollybia butyracea]|uniref:Uncharacterized protein n=1 Tax=Rhodocollybia butyracea TaxID=206335 RepID=A0A9P5PPN7_9AGAR|nr:hypothetical protein BDP27DRAFT_1365202 [Rhodocollybia butyracea]